MHVEYIQHYKKYISGDLLDAGCGEKPYSLIYKDLVDSYIGCDVETCVHEQTYVDVFVTVDELPFANDAFDTILCTNVMEHVSNAEKGFSELSRCLKSGGYLLVSTPFLYPLHEAPYDFYRYTVYGLKYQLEKNGMEIVNINSQGGFGILVVVYFNLILTRVLKVSLIAKISCAMQKVFMYLYMKIYNERMFRELSGIRAILSCGYFIVAKKI